MKEAQGPGSGALEPQSYGGGGFGPPPTPSKDHHYNNSGSGGNNNSTSNNNGGSNGLIELTSSSDTTTHLTLLKNAPLSNSSSSPHSNTNSLTGLLYDTDGRMSDTFNDLRFVDHCWEYPSDSLNARLIDTRSIDSPDNGGPDPYRPWEQPNTNQQQHPHQSPTSSNNTNNDATPVSTTSDNGISSTNGNDKSPTTLTPLTNVFPTFSETFASNGHKPLPSFQSQFNFHENQSPGHVMQPSLALDANGAPALPSFNTVAANRGYVHNTIHQGSHGGPTSTTIVTTQTQPHPQFLEDRHHIQLFPSQVHLGQGQFGQLIATTTSAQPTMTISTNGNHLASPHGHHHHFNGNGVNGGTYGGILSVPPTPSPVAPPPPTSTPGGTIQLQELVPVPPMHAIFHHSPLLSNNNSNKVPPHQTTDGNLPGLNLNLIHHPHDPHHPSNPHPHHPPPLHMNLNLPKYLHGAGIQANEHNMNPIEAHLIAVKLPPNHHYDHPSPHHGQINPNMLHNHHQQLPPHLVHHQQGVEHHHISKMEQQQQCSPQIVSTNTNGNRNGSNNNNNGTNGTPKRQNRKRKNMDHHHLHVNHNNHQQGGILGDNGITHIPNHDLNDPQVSSVSSTDSDFKRPSLGLTVHGNGMNGNGHNHGGMSDGVDAGLDKPVKKKRKRCGECIGCQRKDNCGDCAPCRNDKSHQICKMRRCDKLTEKKTPKVKLKQQQQQPHG